MSEVFAELTVVETASRDEVELQKWYNDSWEFRKEITLSLNTATGVGSDLTDFPVLISFTDTELIQTKESLGRDFVFTESDGKTVLSHEIEKFDNTTGELIAWVKLPTMSASSTTDIYIYYKGDTIGFNSADVWNDDYVLVWHLNQTSTGTVGEFRDSTSNGNDGRGGGGTKVQYIAGRIPHDTEGQIGNGQELKGPTQTTFGAEGSGDFIWTHDKIEGMPQRDFTIELWVGDVVNGPDNANNYKYNDLVAFCTTHNNNGDDQWSNHVNLMRSGNVKMKVYNEFYVSTSNPGHPVDDNNPAAFTNWNHIVAVYNTRDADGTSGKSQLYINGELVKDQNRSGGLNHPLKTSDLRMALGADLDHNNSNSCAYANNELKGKVDELRISSGLRTASYAAASYFNQGDPDTYTTVDVEETRIESEEKNDSECYDCKSPKLNKLKVNVRSINSSPDTDNSIPQVSETKNYVWNFNTFSTLPIFGDNVTPISANPGDNVEIILQITDNRSVKKIFDAGTYTNFLERPSDMNLFFANNFDNSGKVSTAFYEWYKTKDNVEYDYFDFVEWDEPEITIEESYKFEKNGFVENDDFVIGTFTISFNMRFMEPMSPSQVWVQATDRQGNFFKVPLPLLLKISGNEPLVFDSPIRQNVLSFYDESKMSEVISSWSGSSNDVEELSALLGIGKEQLPQWVVNLSMWVSEDEITIGEMIVAIEHLINN